MPSYGQYAVAEPLSSLERLHFHDGTTPLKAVEHVPATPVLDQEDLFAQGIDTSKLVKGAKRVDALGSCVPNATVSALGSVLSTQKLTALGLGSDPVKCETAAIGFYNDFTDLTGNSSSEWPPTDCGSSGLYACEYLEAKQVISTHAIASGAENICSLLQQGGLIVGQPFFYSWESPAANGFIDGNGTLADFHAAVKSGVAGGHETYWEAIDSIAFNRDGSVNKEKTVIRFRNSWSKSWAQGGYAFAHLSTFIRLGSQVDYRLLIA